MKNTVIGVYVDDKAEKAIYDRAFERMEARVDGHVFISPEEGIAAMKETTFDVVFIELHYRGEDFGGITILRQLQKSLGYRVIPIAVTSLLQEGDIERIISAGFVICLEKPVSIEAFEIFCGQAAVN